MSEGITRDVLGALVGQTQAELRSLRTEQVMLRKLLSEVVSATLLDRIGSTEALMETRFDRLEARMDQTERSVEQRPDRIERLLRPS